MPRVQSQTSIWLTRVAVVVGVFLALQLAVALGFLLNLRPSLSPPSSHLADVATEHGGVHGLSFQTPDDVTLRGELMGEPAVQPVIILAHGYRGTRRDTDRLAERLLTEGYAVFNFDFRGSGNSDGMLTGLGALEDRDLAAVVAQVQLAYNVKPGRIAAIGFSMGAVAIAQAAPDLPKLGAAVLVAPYASLEETIDLRAQRWVHTAPRPWLTPAFWLSRLLFEIDIPRTEPVAHIGQLAPTPVLLIGSDADWRATPAVQKRLLAAAREPKSLKIFQKFDHAELGRYPSAVADEIVKFLAATLGPGRLPGVGQAEIEVPPATER